jgi:hypothetical protein
MDYNFQYILDLHNSDETSYEKEKIIHMIDRKLSQYDQTNDRKMLFHIVPIVFSFTILSGLVVFVTQLIG